MGHQPEFEIRGSRHQLMEPNTTTERRLKNGGGLKERQISASPSLLANLAAAAVGGEDNDAERQLPLLTCQRGRNA